MDEKTERLQSCPPKNYRALMITQMQVYRNHIDTHLAYHPDIPRDENPLAHFFGMFGIFFRQIFCSFACPDREICDVRAVPPFNIKRWYTFEELKSLPSDLSMGCLSHDCPHNREQNAVQLFLANDPGHLEKHKYYHRIHGPGERERTKRHFLKMYGPLLHDMYCSAACPAMGTCKKKGNIYIPERYA
ncbi:MAG TPA: hypothetical protein VMX75_06145 [Spirochaetia bacterium]|nr:hypothetical protein [Spirochaetia bacterium]